MKIKMKSSRVHAVNDRLVGGMEAGLEGVGMRCGVVVGEREREAGVPIGLVSTGDITLLGEDGRR